ncbi:hypothetical protein [Tenacibaculum sp. 47A_GOM-205m]|uniref:hypothetical protein n=1 Tax=Tenacibaculum sp. 47A_GOM-205m TaxID=1380384 RepID=UPI0004907A23|nr:hypothetical protein [Tenacibaculum sp. 47A_GOM-205m]
MKNIVFIICLLIASFNTYSQQVEFENEFGQENVKILNSLLKDFETNTLKKEYPNVTLENAYKEFLEAIVEENYSVLEKSRGSFKENNFKLHIYCVPDSAWIEKRLPSSEKKGFLIKERYKYLTINNTIGYTESTIFCCDNKDKTLELLKKDRVQVHLSGLYIKALKKISNKSEFIKNYLHYIQITADPIHPNTMSNYILMNDIDVNDYFVKRILFINNVYR